MTTAYYPSNATEGDAFERRWCAHCLRENPVAAEDELGDYEAGCPILVAAAVSQPAEWTIRDGEPWCSAFVEDKANPARCLFTKEMEI